MRPSAPARASFLVGIRAAVPLALAVVPFGVVYGVAASESSVGGLLGGAASWIILGGAAQLSLIGLIDAGAPWSVGVTTALVINSRFGLYSVALAPAFRAFPTRWRFTLPYLLTDQAGSLAIAHFDTEHDPHARRWFFLGTGLLFASGWWLGTVAGVISGGVLPDDLDIGFAIPAMFIALLVMGIADRAMLFASLTAIAVATLTAPLPNGLNVLAGAFCGIGTRVVSRRGQQPA